MRYLLAATALGGLFLANAGCPHQIRGVITSEERKIWVITTDYSGNQEVYRCGDAATNDQLPNPICKHAPLTPVP
jgi:hypothetical protein